MGDGNTVGCDLVVGALNLVVVAGLDLESADGFSLPEREELEFDLE